MRVCIRASVGCDGASVALVRCGEAAMTLLHACERVMRYSERGPPQSQSLRLRFAGDAGGETLARPAKFLLIAPHLQLSLPLRNAFSCHRKPWDSSGPIFFTQIRLRRRHGILYLEDRNFPTIAKAYRRYDQRVLQVPPVERTDFRKFPSRQSVPRPISSQVPGMSLRLHERMEEE